MAQQHILPIVDRTSLSAAPSEIQAVTVTTTNGGTETAFTFAALGLHDMQNTTYCILATCQEASTTTIEVKATTRATTGFTLTHENEELTVDVVVMGEAKRG